MVTNLRGSAGLIEEKKSGIFLKIANRYCVFEQRFEIKSLKLLLRQKFGLIHQKQRNNEEFLVLQLLRHQHDDYDVILSN